MKRVIGATIAFGLLAGALWLRQAPAAELTATEILAKNAVARGGAEAWRKVETMAWSGHIESRHAPAAGMQFKLEQKRPNRTRLEITALGETSIRVFDGAHGWKLRATPQGPDVQPYSAQELMFARAAHGIDGPLLDAAARGSAVTLRGVDELGGRKAYHLDVRLGAEGHEEVWVDTETYLDVRYDRFVTGPANASRRISATYGDYRTVHGLKIPFLIETGAESATPDKMQIETVTLNAPLDASRFGAPSDSRWRGRVRGGTGSAALRSGQSSGTSAQADTHGATQ